MSVKRDHLLVLAVLAGLLLSGCATARYDHGYRIEGRTYQSLGDMDDDTALKMVAALYNVHARSYTEQIAKDLTLETYLEALRQRNSDYIDTSGIYDVPYDRVDLSGMPSEDLVRLFNELEKEYPRYRHVDISSLSEARSARRIIGLTGMYEIAGELRRRDNTRRAWAFLGQALQVALSVAVSSI
ncbi:MAG: hypothetical protein GF392_00815 [Candidatus Omnitrophica bacterium]|nr:hypothetical protein [Candidatus Omnitrophota bacterium]